MNLSRQVLGILGLLIGFGLYSLSGRLGAPWNSVLIGAVFAGLGISALVYGRGERWIQGLGLALLLYGLVRVFFLHR
ncbi:hypothetical protein [Deinococcus sp.]|uniref:hypothetical protein n=1 Tax=Deinococcus sp. TaxID=47478 RepID=UPI003CC50EEB